MADGPEAREKCETTSWTGEHDPIAPRALLITLALGSLGFLIIGAFTLG